jgi:hypothetical protein
LRQFLFAVTAVANCHRFMVVKLVVIIGVQQLKISQLCIFKGRPFNSKLFYDCS